MPPSTNGLTAASFPLRPITRAQRADPYFNRIVDLMMNGTAAQKHALAWYYFDHIGALRYIARYVANSLSMATLYAARASADPFQPERLPEDHPANMMLQQWAGGPLGHSELLDALGVHLTITGDSFIAGPWDQRAADEDPFDRWRAYSSFELTSRNGKLYYQDFANQERPIPKGSLAVRIWRPHPKNRRESDSPTLSSFTVLEELDLMNKHVKASLTSRLCGAGVQLIPDECTMSMAADSEVEVDGVEIDPYVRRMVEVMGIAIQQPGSAAAKVPVAVRGPAEALREWRHMTYDTPLDERIPEMRLGNLRQLALGMDIPPEILTGSGESTSWSAWQTQSSTVQLHTHPMMGLVVASLTTGWLQPALRKRRDLPASVVRELDDIIIWYDLSRLKVRQDTVGESENLYDRFEIDGDTLRLSANAPQEAKPDKKELARQILLQIIRTTPDQMQYAVNALREMGEVDLPEMFWDTAFGPVESTPKSRARLVAPGSAPPGERSQAKQTSAPPAPSVTTDPSHNTP